MVSLVVAGSELAGSFRLSETVGLSREMMKGLGEVFDNQAILPREILVFVLRNLPTRDESVKSV